MNYQCSAITLKGEQCKKKHIVNSPFCVVHNKFTNCGICLEDKSQNVELLNCGHSFCKDCIYIWLFENDTCPICRIKVETSERASGKEYCILKGIILPVRIRILHFCENLRITEETKLVIQSLLVTNFDGYEISEKDFSLFLNYIIELYKHFPIKYAGVMNAVSSMVFYYENTYRLKVKMSDKLYSFKYII